MKRSPLNRGTSQLRRTSLRKRGRKPIKRDGGIKQNPAYLEWIRTLPCVLACEDCRGIVQSAHVGVRGLGQKAADETAIPLCDFHHCDNRSGHHSGKSFWTKNGLDRDALVRYFNRRYAE